MGRQYLSHAISEMTCTLPSVVPDRALGDEDEEDHEDRDDDDAFDAHGLYLACWSMARWQPLAWVLQRVMPTLAS